MSVDRPRFQRSSAAREERGNSDRWKGRRLLERIDRAYQIRARSTGVSHGNCKCNHRNKNWLSSDVKRKGRRWKGLAANTGGTRGRRDREEGEYNVTVRWIGGKSISAGRDASAGDCKYEIAYVYRVNEVYRIPARPARRFIPFVIHVERLLCFEWNPCKFIRTNVASNYFFFIRILCRKEEILSETFGRAARLVCTFSRIVRVITVDENWMTKNTSIWMYILARDGIRTTRNGSI